MLQENGDLKYGDLKTRRWDKNLEKPQLDYSEYFIEDVGQVSHQAASSLVSSVIFLLYLPVTYFTSYLILKYIYCTFPDADPRIDSVAD